MTNYNLDKKLAVLLVDDDPLILDVLRINVERHLDSSFEVFCASSGEEGLEIVNEILEEGEFYIGLVVSDFIMPKMLGTDFLLQLNQLVPRTKKMMLTGQADAERVIGVLCEMEMFRFITKPWNPHTFPQQILAALNEFSYLKFLELKFKSNSGF